MALQLNCDPFPSDPIFICKKTIFPCPKYKIPIWRPEESIPENNMIRPNFRLQNGNERGTWYNPFFLNKIIPHHTTFRFFQPLALLFPPHAYNSSLTLSTQKAAKMGNSKASQNQSMGNCWGKEKIKRNGNYFLTYGIVLCFRRSSATWWAQHKYL